MNDCNMISVVIPLYNKEKSIISTLESVLAQTYMDYEVIIVDDGSTDRSVDLVREYVRTLQIDDFKFQIINQKNSGVSAARNTGVLAAKGEFVALLDADDLWDENYLTEQVKMIRDFPEAAMWGINFAEIRNRKIVRRVSTGLPDGFQGYVENYFKMKGRVSDLYCSSSVVICKEVFDKVGMFDERIKYAEDTDMWFRIIATNPVAFYDKYLAFYQWDAENRAMERFRDLRYFLPYYVDKYREPQFKRNKVFYRWVNRWSAVHIRRYYFSDNQENRIAAKEAAAKLDYSIIPFKYLLLFYLPYGIAKWLNILDLKRRNES